MGSPVVVRHFEHSHDARAPGSLLNCLGVEPSVRVIALVGAGGKTSLMYALAREIVSLGKTVVTTTTTKIFPPEPHESPCLVLVGSHPGLASLPRNLLEFQHVTVAQAYLPAAGKLQGVGDGVIESCAQHADMVVVESDGASRRPIKAPEQWEPVIPERTDFVVPVVGLDCIGTPATRENVFRLERFLDLTEVREGEIITAAAVGRLLSHPQGALKGVPPGVPVRPFLNKRDRLEDAAAIDRISSVIAQQGGGRIDTIVVGSLRGTSPAAPASRHLHAGVGAPEPRGGSDSGS
ncbi:MAG: selenium cofactor biosynthesis protein YqeC [Desulfomonilaceae bacterium]|nr:selenium cofactor biosynthesis protein YqeC [Desulfomonilaceae bacterium]